jgi:hypothetical protein
MSSQTALRITNPRQSTVEDMGIDHRHPHITATEQLLDRAATENLFPRRRTSRDCTYGTRREEASRRMLKKFVQQGRSE